MRKKYYRKERHAEVEVEEGEAVVGEEDREREEVKVK